MLVLTRNIGESVMLGKDIKVTVLGVKHNQVKIGFEAEESISIHREEIYNKIKEEGIKR